MNIGHNYEFINKLCEYTLIKLDSMFNYSFTIKNVLIAQKYT